MNGLFGVELPPPVNFIVAFVVVLALIGAATWLIRRFGATRLDSSARGRQPRLAVIDQAAVDGRRKLVIVRRDNVEHLIMIGGPNDVVVESTIVRGAAMRDTPRTAAEALPRAIPLPDAEAWAPPPEPAPAPVARIERTRVVAQVPAQEITPAVEPVPTAPLEAPAPPSRAARTADALAGLAAELSRPNHDQPRARPAARPAPAVAAPAVAPQVAPPVAPPVAAPDPAAAAADKNLADMAQRLEAALRQPGGAAAQPQPEKPAARPPEQRRAEPRPRQEQRQEPRQEPTLQPAPRQEPAPRPAPAVAAAASAAPAPKSSDNLEQEMASLLGRSGKT